MVESHIPTILKKKFTASGHHSTPTPYLAGLGCMDTSSQKESKRLHQQFPHCVQAEVQPHTRREVLYFENGRPSYCRQPVN